MRAELALLALAALASPAAAGDVTQVLETSRVEVRVWTPWPSSNKGWLPLYVDLSNSGERAQSVSLQATASGFRSSQSLRAGVRLAPGERAHLELLAPLRGPYPATYFVRADTSASDAAVLDSGAGSLGVNNDYQSILVVGPQAPKAGTLEAWTADLSTRAIRARGGGSGGANDDLQFGFATWDALPQSSIAYSSLDLAVLDAREGLPPAERLEPLLGWVRGGGLLLVSGPGAGAQAAQQPSLAAWLEPRFECDGDAGAHAVGFGRVVLSEEEGLFESEPLRALVRELASSGACTTPEARGQRMDLEQPAIPGLGAIPYRVFAALLVLFAVLIGPVNFVLVKRTKRPVLLLVTIPGIALATSLVLLAYGVFFQGLDVKTGSNSIALLDQRTHRAACIEKRLLYAGLAPSGGLRPQLGTAVHPLSLSSNPGFPYGNERQENLVIEAGAELALSGDFLPTRTTVLQQIVSERAERARLDVARAGETYEVTNNLGTALDELVLRDASGAYFASTARVEPGAKARLAPAADGAPRARLLLTEPLTAVSGSRQPLPGDGASLPPASYAASLASNVFGDDCGVELHEQAGRHRLWGVLALDEEAWR